MDRVAGTTYRVVPLEQMQSALVQFGYPADAILPPVVARGARAPAAGARPPHLLARQERGRRCTPSPSRLAGVNDDAGNVVVVRQAAGAVGRSSSARPSADQFDPAVKSADDAKECTDLRASKPDKAAEAARKAIGILPTNGLAQYCLAMLALDRKAPSTEVIASLQEAVKGDPQSLPGLDAARQGVRGRGRQRQGHRGLPADAARGPDQPAASRGRVQALPPVRPARTPPCEVAKEGLKLDPVQCRPLGPPEQRLRYRRRLRPGDRRRSSTSTWRRPTAPTPPSSCKVTVFAAVQPDTAALLKWARLRRRQVSGQLHAPRPAGHGLQPRRADRQPRRGDQAA